MQWGYTNAIHILSEKLWNWLRDSVAGILKYESRRYGMPNGS